jgi:acetyl-CoA carboxylase biotin carboxyl carrier protein
MFLVFVGDIMNRPSKKVTRKPDPAPAAEAAGATLADEVSELARVLREFDLSEIEVDRDGTRLRVKREVAVIHAVGHAGPVVAPPVVHAPVVPVPVPAPAAPAAATAHAPAPAAAAPAHPAVYITSPFVGTFYRSPSPESPAFVDVGARVRKGQVLCIIEAMKLMNEIEAEVDGTIVAVMAENGQPVEYGEPLFQIRP